jgi:hypothetical protein
MPSRERRRQLADELFTNLVNRTFSFWDHVHTLFLNRDMTRHDLRELVRRGLAATGGNYRALLKLFGMEETDYKRFLNFLATHECNVDYRMFRRGIAPETPIRPSLVPSHRHHGRAAGGRTSVRPQ